MTVPPALAVLYLIGGPFTLGLSWVVGGIHLLVAVVSRRATLAR